jgi:hypothetical protein
VDNRKPQNASKVAILEQSKMVPNIYAIRLFEQCIDLLYERFLQTDFGKLYQTMPSKVPAEVICAPGLPFV